MNREVRRANGPYLRCRAEHVLHNLTEMPVTQIALHDFMDDFGPWNDTASTVHAVAHELCRLANQLGGRAWDWRGKLRLHMFEGNAP